MTRPRFNPDTDIHADQFQSSLEFLSHCYPYYVFNDLQSCCSFKSPQCCLLTYGRDFKLVMFPNHEIISPEADFIVYSADGPRRANFDPSVLYKGTLECKEMLLLHVYS